MTAPGHPSNPASDGGSAPAGTPASDCPGCCGEPIGNVTRCCGTEVYEAAQRANGGRAPTIRIGRPSAGFGGETDTSTGTITVSDTLDACQQTQVALFELANLAAKDEFDRVDAQARAGELSREDYARAMERIEYNNLKTAAAAEANCMAQWGCAGQTPRHAWVNGARDFDDYYDNHLADSHKNHYRNFWDSAYRAAYRARHP